MLDGNSRRTVLKLMAASFGLAGLAACNRPVEHVFPNSTGTEAGSYLPGEPFFYSTVMSIGGHVTGLLVETHDGRPTKIEGNPEHPHSLGAATAMQQALVLGVYDPDRSAKVLKGRKVIGLAGARSGRQGCWRWAMARAPLPRWVRFVAVAGRAARRCPEEVPQG